MRLSPSNFVACAALWACLAPLSGITLANPDSLDPFKPFAVHGRGAVRPDDAAQKAKFDAEYENLAKDDALIREKLAKLDATNKAGGLHKLKPGDLSGTYIQIEHLRRAAQNLEDYGETSGLDLKARVQNYHAVLGKMIESYRGGPNATMFSQKYPEFEKMGKAQENNLKQVRQALAGDKPFEAETKINAILDTLNNMAVFYIREQWTKVMSPFQEAEGQVKQAASNARLTESERLLAEARDAERPDYKAVLDALAQAAANVQKAGKSQANERELTGPELVTHFGEEWKRVQLASLRVRGLELARGDTLARLRGGKSFDLARLQKIDEEHASFTLGMVSGLVALITADTARVPDAEATALHAAYLKSVAPLVALQIEDKLAVQCDEALQKLAAKSPALASAEPAYRAVVGQTLKWRRRIADTQTKFRESSYPFAGNKLVEGMLPKPPYIGLLASSERSTSVCRLQGTGPESIINLDAVIKGARVRLDRHTRIPQAARALQVSRYSERFLALGEGKQAPAAMIEAFKLDLIAGGTTPGEPLTLEAAVALFKAENGYWETGGAEIEGAQLKSVSTTFATAKSPLWTMTLLGPLPSDPIDDRSRPLNWVLVQMKVRVEWMRHDCFLVDFPAGGALSSALLPSAASP